MEYAIIRLNGKQYMVKKGSLMKIDRVHSETVVDVLMYGDEKDAIVGTSVVEGFGVKFEILEDKKDKKISVRRYKSKSRYRKENGHRQPISIVKVSDFGKGIKTGFVASTRSTDIEVKAEAVEKVEKAVEAPKAEVKPKVEKVAKTESKTAKVEKTEKKPATTVKKAPSKKEK